MEKRKQRHGAFTSAAGTLRHIMHAERRRCFRYLIPAASTALRVRTSGALSMHQAQDIYIKSFSFGLQAVPTFTCLRSKSGTSEARAPYQAVPDFCRYCVAHVVPAFHARPVYVGYTVSLRPGRNFGIDLDPCGFAILSLEGEPGPSLLPNPGGNIMMPVLTLTQLHPLPVHLQL